MSLSKTEIRQELEWRKCRKDPFYFIERYWFIRHPERGRILLKLRPAQHETLQTWLDERLTIALKARQIGFSTLAAALAFWETFFTADRFDIMLSRTERDASKLLAKAQYGYRWLPDWMKKRGPKLLTAETHLSKMTFDNDSAIESLPASDPARGESAYRIFVDEWAFFPDPESAYAAIEPAADVGGRITALSTANGSGNLFHRMYVEAKTRKSEFRAIFHSWRAADRDDAWYESKKRSMLEWQLHQEYPSDDVEAFIRSGRTYFDIGVLDALPLERGKRGFLFALGEKVSEFRPNEEGPLEVWEMPKLGRKYVIGADVAEGLEHGDYSVAHVIDHLDGRVVAKWRGHIDPDLFGSDVLWHLGWFYNQALVGPEVNNHGYATCKGLQNRGYWNIYYRHTYDEAQAKKTRKIGWRTQQNTKPLMLDELGAAVRSGELRLCDEETIAEMRTFVIDEGGKTHGSPYDDYVISLAIANQMRKHVFVVTDEEDPDEVPFGSGEWWDRVSRPQSNDTWRIGVHSTR